MASSTAVLITGCSTGIGRATALRLTRRPDLTVYATARRLESIADLADLGCRTLALAGPDAVAKAIEKAITARRPRTRYPVTPSARLFMGQRALLPDRAWDAVVGSSFPRPS